MVMTREVSVAIRGINLVSENATHPQIKVANNILPSAFQKLLSRISPPERFCKIESKITISINAPTDYAAPRPSTPQPAKYATTDKPTVSPIATIETINGVLVS